MLVLPALAGDARLPRSCLALNLWLERALQGAVDRDCDGGLPGSIADFWSGKPEKPALMPLPKAFDGYCRSQKQAGLAPPA